jgi:hypothetical protein
MNTEKLVAIAGTYLRAAFASSVLAMYIAGITDPKALGSAFLASLAAPILKALDSKETAYGKGSE